MTITILSLRNRSSIGIMSGSKILCHPLLIAQKVLSSFYVIKSTERGVLSTFGKISETPVSDGLHVKIPFIQTVNKVNIQQKKFDGHENSYTRDVQTSEVEYTINYDLVKSNVSNLIKNIGENYHERIVVPFIRSAMKQAFGNFNATQIVERSYQHRTAYDPSFWLR